MGVYFGWVGMGGHFLYVDADRWIIFLVGEGGWTFVMCGWRWVVVYGGIFCVCGDEWTIFIVGADGWGVF